MKVCFLDVTKRFKTSIDRDKTCLQSDHRRTFTRSAPHTHPRVLPRSHHGSLFIIGGSVRRREAPSVINPNPEKDEAFTGYFRILNKHYLDTWQVFKGDVSVEPKNVHVDGVDPAPDPDDMRWMYVKGSGNAFSARMGPGWIFGTKASLINCEVKPDKPEKLWRVAFDKKRSGCEWGSDFTDPDCHVVDGMHVGDGMDQPDLYEDYQMKWRTTRQLVFTSNDADAKPVDVLISTTGAWHITIRDRFDDSCACECAGGDEDEKPIIYGGSFTPLKSVVTVEGHPPFENSLQTETLAFTLPGEFSGARLSAKEKSKWKQGMRSDTTIHPPQIEADIESGTLDSSMKLLLTFLLGCMLVEREGVGYYARDYPFSTLKFKMGHALPEVGGKELDTTYSSKYMLDHALDRLGWKETKGIAGLIKDKCAGAKETWHQETYPYKMKLRSEYPDVPAVKLDAVTLEYKNNINRSGVFKKQETGMAA